jgi:RNA polymerase sigma-54 factor
VVPDAQCDIGEYLISNIDETGYLDCAISEVAASLNVSDQEVEAVLALIQTFEPSGIGARDLQECLRLQLDHLEEDGRGNPLALAIVRDCWQDMVAKRVSRMARRLRVSQKEILSALGFIRRSLNPYPGNSFRTPWASNREAARSSVRPDVIVRRTPTGYEVEVMQNDQYLLAINSHYRRVYENLKNGSGKVYSDDEKKHIVEFVERADLFIRNLNQRRRTLRLITRAIVEFQQGYVETGSKLFLRPLTRTKIARKISVHESTVSRATANKYVQLPSEEVVPFEFFFDSSVSVKDVICDLIGSEDPSSPLSDQSIAQILQERGLDVARRTVVKYREAQKILSSRQRRR